MNRLQALQAGEPKAGIKLLLIFVVLLLPILPNQGTVPGVR
jgi:hypothetical protein